MTLVDTPAARGSRPAPATRTKKASSSATACGSSGRSYGKGEPTVFLLPTWSIIHSRHWKLQIPYLARHFRVLTFDGRGNGKSATARAGSRPTPSGSSPRTRSRSWTRRARSRRSSWGSLRGPLGNVARRRTPGAGRWARYSSARPCRSPPDIPSGTSTPSRRSSTPTKAGRSTTATTGSSVTRSSSNTFSPRFSPSRTRRSRSRTASAGGSRLRRRRSSRAPRRWTRAASRTSAHLRPGALPGARAARERGRDPSARPGRRARGSDRRDARHARGLGPSDRTRATPCRVNLLLREFVQTLEGERHERR